MQLKENCIAHIRYTTPSDLHSENEEVTNRVIIPTYVPGDCVNALDVSLLPEDTALLFQKLQQQYAQYVEARMNTIFSFEDWISHTQDVEFYADIKHRTFKTENIEVIESQ